MFCLDHFGLLLCLNRQKYQLNNLDSSPNQIAHIIFRRLLLILRYISNFPDVFSCFLTSVKGYKLGFPFIKAVTTMTASMAVPKRVGAVMWSSLCRTLLFQSNIHIET